MPAFVVSATYSPSHSEIKSAVVLIPWFIFENGAQITIPILLISLGSEMSIQFS